MVYDGKTEEILNCMTPTYYVIVMLYEENGGKLIKICTCHI